MHALNETEYQAKNKVCLSDFSKSNNGFYPIKHFAMCCLHDHLNNQVTP